MGIRVTPVYKNLYVILAIDSSRNEYKTENPNSHIKTQKFKAEKVRLIGDLEFLNKMKMASPRKSNATKSGG